MKSPVHLVLGATLRLYVPLLTLFALSLLTTWPANSGVGFVAGLAVSLVLALHVLLFGAKATRGAFPPLFARVLLSTGVIAVFAAAGLPNWSQSDKALEVGVFVSTIGATALIFIVLSARAPTLRDEDW